MRDAEEIYQEMLAAYAQRRGGQIREDCELAIRLWAAAAQIQTLETQAEWVLKQSFPQTAAGIYLERHAAVRGITRQTAARAKGALTFTLANAQVDAVTVPAGTVCMTAGAVRFQTTEEGVIAAGEKTVRVAAEAVETGESGNTGPGAVYLLTACPVAVVSVCNEDAFTGGAAEETDEELRIRLLDSFQRLPNGANAAWYEQTACRYDGVAAAKAIGRARGIGTVDVYVAAPEGAPPGSLLAELQAVFQKSREIAVDVLVKAPELKTVDIALTVETAEGSSFAEVKPAVEKVIADCFGGKLLGRAVNLAELGHRVYEVPGVANYHFLQPEADVEASDTVLPVLGELSVTEEAAEA